MEENDDCRSTAYGTTDGQDRTSKARCRAFPDRSRDIDMAYRAPLFEQEPLVYPVVASSTFRLRSAHEGFLLCEGKVKSNN